MATNFPAYRDFEAARIAANDAMMALLVGSRLGQVAIDSMEAEKQDRYLPELFPDIDDVRRLNRTAKDTRELLANAESHLASMAIPFILSVYQDFATDVIDLMRQDGLAPGTDDPKRIPLEELHTYLVEKCGLPLSGMELALFDFIRQLRNRIVHFGGTPGSHLRAAYARLPEEAKALWRKLTGGDFTTGDSKSPLVLGSAALYPVLAVTKRLSKGIVGELSRRLSRSQWADVVVADYHQVHAERLGGSARRLRRIFNYAKHQYSSLELTEGELADALNRWEEDRRRGSSY